MIVTKNQKCIKYLKSVGINAYEQNGTVIVDVEGYDNTPFSLELSKNEIEYRARLFDEMAEDMMLNSPSPDEELLEEIEEGQNIKKITQRFVKEEKILGEYVYYMTLEEYKQFKEGKLDLSDFERFDENIALREIIRENYNILNH